MDIIARYFVAAVSKLKKENMRCPTLETRTAQNHVVYILNFV